MHFIYVTRKAKAIVSDTLDEKTIRKVLEENDWDLQKSITPLIHVWTEMEDVARQVSRQFVTTHFPERNREKTKGNRTNGRNFYQSEKSMKFRLNFRTSS